MLKERNIATSVILSIITCGIYSIIWYISLIDEIKYASKSPEGPSGGVVFILGILTCGIYTLYWYYKMGQLMHKAMSDAGLPAEDRSVLYLILSIFGLSIVSMCLAQSDLNNVIRKTNMGSMNMNY